MNKRPSAYVIALTLSLLLSIASFVFVACTTTASTATVSSRVAQIAAQEPGDIALVLTPVLLKNPKYAPDCALIGNTLPALIANGPITPSSYTSAVASIPNITAQEQQDLALAGLVLNAGLQLYQAYSNQAVALYTDPNVKALVDGFCAGLVEASKVIPAPAPTVAP